MGRTNFCIMCLAMGTTVRMYPMNSRMKRIYHELILIPHQSNIPQMYACYECAHLMLKHEKFRMKCCKAFNILCSLNPNPFQVTGESLKFIDHKQMGLAPRMSSITFCHEYDPNENRYGLDEQFNIKNVKSDPISFENNVTNNVNDPVEIMPVIKQDIDSMEQMNDYEYQPLDVKSIPQYSTPAINHNYQFTHTFQDEHSNCKPDTDNMLWITIEGKPETEGCSNKPIEMPTQLNQQYSNTVPSQNYFDNNLSEHNYAFNEANYKSDNIIKIKIEKQIEKDEDNKDKKNEKKKKSVSHKATHGVFTLDSKLLNDHMTVVEFTPEDAMHEFLLRKNSTNYIRNPFKCDLCYRGFLSKTSYESHMKKHSSKNGPLQCNICKMCYMTKKHLTQHHQAVHKWKFSCKVCPYVCFSLVQCKSHILSHEGKKYTCKKCGMTYRFRNSLLTHTRLKHNVECVCEFCGSTFASELGLSNHKNIVHRQENNEHLGPQCDECDVHFASELAWKRHRVLCSRHEVQFGCKVCGDEFENSESLKLHSREHEDIAARREYYKYKGKTCVICNLNVPDKAALKKHLLSEHKITDDAPKSTGAAEASFVCEICGKAFVNRCYLVAHQVKHSDEMPYSCPDCGKRTKHKYYMTAHRKTHLQEYVDKYLCDLCKRPFSDKGRLARHMKGHMGIRPIKCVACEKTFMFRCDERAHYRHFHNKEPYPKKNANAKPRRTTTHARIKVIDNI